MMKRLFPVLLAGFLLLAGCSSDTDFPDRPQKEAGKGYDITLEFPVDRYPETGAHIRDAVREGHSEVCTIDRKGAEENRKLSLRSVPTKKGYDRDEWPMAFCHEGGKNAHITYISPSDNRGAGSWVSHEVEKYPDGTRVKFMVKDIGEKAPETAVPVKRLEEKPEEKPFEDKNCSDFQTQEEAKEYLLPGDPHRLDPNKNGVPCEHLPAS